MGEIEPNGEDVGMIPVDEPEISDEEKALLRATTGLPFALPAELLGLEELVAQDAERLAVDPLNPAEFEVAARYVVRTLERRVSAYRALGRMASNSGSLPARLVSSSSSG